MYPRDGEFWNNEGAVVEALGLEGESEEAYAKSGTG